MNLFTYPACMQGGGVGGLKPFDKMVQFSMMNLIVEIMLKHNFENMFLDL